MPGPMIAPEWCILLGSTLVHAIGLAWVARHEAMKLLTAWRRRRVVASDLDHAMFTVYLEGNWEWITKKMTTEEREAALAAIERYLLDQGDPEDAVFDRSRFAWWEN